MNLYKIWRDIVNYIFLLRQISKAKRTTIWKDLGLRQGWVGQVWTVVNLRKEDMGEQKEVQNIYVAEKVKPINKFLQSYDLEELLYVRIGRVEDTLGWLVIYWPNFHYISRGLVFRWIIGLIAISLIFKYTTAWDGIVWLWGWVSSLVVDSGLIK